MIKILIGGSPCTNWSIAKNNRETSAEGIGWELFKNYFIAKDKFRPDFFLYENVSSASKEIKKQIAYELGTDLQEINSALVSAQNRKRIYGYSGGHVDLPEDRGILLQDIIESGTVWQEKSYSLTTRCNGAIPSDTLNRHRHTMIAEPVCVAQRGRYSDTGNRSSKGNGKVEQHYEPRLDGKTNTLTTVQKDNMVAQTVRIGQLDSNAEYPVYEVKNGIITIKDKTYPIKLQDGFYIIRKLTPIECERLQTMPDGYTEGISNTQRYKCLGNGWTAEVIIHIMRHMFRNVPRNEKVVVLSMYDGIATGRYCLEQLGFTNIEYHAYEIDKYAIKVAGKNYPDIKHYGDAFAVREDGWHL